MKLVLASGSATRAKMLREAGVPVEVMPCRVDEAPIKERLRGVAPKVLAVALAEAKAREVAARYPGRLILGGDQVLDLAGATFDKPYDLTHARAQLERLRGETHSLISAGVIVQGSRVVWQGIGLVRLTMREFSDDFLDDYIAKEGEALLWTVGCYRIEGLGAQLFERIEGDWFSILGLPLLDIMTALRESGGLQS